MERLAVPFPALLLALAAAQTPVPAAQLTPHRMGRPFISPMGEPFITPTPGQDTLSTWFAQADSNHDGNLSAIEMQQDAARFFTLLDLNHDGEIDPDEMTNYETVIAPQVHTGAAMMRARQEAPSGDDGGGGGDGDEGGGRGGGGEGGGGGGGGGGGHRGGGGGGGGHRGGGEGGGGGGGFTTAGPTGPEGAARFGLLNIPEPVAAADTNLNRGVSTDEFRQAAISRFQLLDTNHDGRLTVAELEALRPSGPPPGARGHGRGGGGHRGGGGPQGDSQPIAR
jgi:Ca2+-binding EF-hand superfamily protein